MRSVAVAAVAWQGFAVPGRAFAAVSAAAAAPPSLTGEKLNAEADSPTTSAPYFLGLCGPSVPVPGGGDYTASQSFAFTGAATGPFPGTFKESGKITTTFPPGHLPPGYTGTVSLFSVSFKITSAAGTVSGTKSLTVAGQPAQCGGGAGGTTFSADLAAQYTATITTSTGTYQDHGTSGVALSSAWSYANVSYATLAESFIAAPVNTSPPTIGTAPGNTVVELHGTWTGNPTSYSYQWQRCDSAGASCTAITGATEQSYALAGADVGHTIRAQEWATNGGGTTGPATSSATGLIEAPPSPPSPPPPPSNPPPPPSLQPTPPNPPPANPAPPMLPPTPVSQLTGAQITAQLLGQLAPRGRAATITSVLRAGGYSCAFKTLGAGRIVIAWYNVPKGATLSRAKAKTVLIASGQASFSRAGLVRIRLKLTAAGRRMLSATRRLALTAKGTYVLRGRRGVIAIRAFTLRR